MTGPDHHLTLINGTLVAPPGLASEIYAPPRGRCSCGWSMIGPHDLIRLYHRTHLQETTP